MDAWPAGLFRRRRAAEMFRADLVAALGYSDGAQGGRPPFDVVMMFKVLCKIGDGFAIVPSAPRFLLLVCEFVLRIDLGKANGTA